jgi:hypothetical protein
VLKGRELAQSKNLILGVNREIQEPEYGKKKIYEYQGTEKIDGVYQQIICRKRNTPRN